MLNLDGSFTIEQGISFSPPSTAALNLVWPSNISTINSIRYDLEKSTLKIPELETKLNKLLNGFYTKISEKNIESEWSTRTEQYYRNLFKNFDISTKFYWLEDNRFRQIFLGKKF